MLRYLVILETRQKVEERTSVQVIEALVDELDAHEVHWPASRTARLLVCRHSVQVLKHVRVDGGRRAEAVSADERRAREERIAGALEGEPLVGALAARDARHSEPVRPEPALVVRAFGAALRVRVARQVHRTAAHEAAVCREHLVRQVGRRFDSHDLHAVCRCSLNALEFS